MTPDDLAGLWVNDERAQHLILSSRDGGAWLAVADTSLRLDEERPGLFRLPAFRLKMVADAEADHVEVVLDGKPATFHRVAPWQPAASDLVALCGSYWSDELEVMYEIVRAAGADGPAIAIRRRKFNDQLFLPIRPDTFGRDSLDFGARVDFVRAEKGRVTGFTLTAGRIRNLVFTRQD